MYTARFFSTSSQLPDDSAGKPRVPREILTPYDLESAPCPLMLRLLVPSNSERALLPLVGQLHANFSLGCAGISAGGVPAPSLLVSPGNVFPMGSLIHWHPHAPPLSARRRREPAPPPVSDVYAAWAPQRYLEFLHHCRVDEVCFGLGDLQVQSRMLPVILQWSAEDAFFSLAHPWPIFFQDASRYGVAGHEHSLPYVQTSRLPRTTDASSPNEAIAAISRAAGTGGRGH